MTNGCCTDCPYGLMNDCKIYSIGENTFCERDKIEGQEIVNYKSYSFTGNEHEKEKKI